MGFNPLSERGMAVEKQLRDWRWLNSVPYDKLTVDPYTKCRIILMNGIEVESIIFSHQFARRVSRGDGVPGELEGDDGVDEPLLRAVMDVALQASPGLVGGGHDPGPGGCELGLVLGVGDRGGGELGELREALLGAGG